MPAAGVRTTPIRTNHPFMDYQIKVLQGLDQGNFAIIITRGVVDLTGFEYILDAVIDGTRSLLDCKVLIDFQDSVLHFRPPDIADFLDRFEFKKWPHNNRMALVSSQDTVQYRRLEALGDSLAKMKLEVRAFCDTREAIDWLTGFEDSLTTAAGAALNCAIFAAAPGLSFYFPGPARVKNFAIAELDYSQLHLVKKICIRSRHKSGPNVFLRGVDGVGNHHHRRSPSASGGAQGHARTAGFLRRG